MRGRALGLLATATYTGLTLGPPLGGLIVSVLGWRSTFFFNIPIAFVVVGLGLRYLPGTSRRGRPGFDRAGAVAMLTGLPLLLLAISEGQRWGISSWLTWLTTAGGLAGIAVFVLIQRKQAAPLLDLSLFRSSVFTGSVLSAVANYIALFVVIILVPFYLEEGMGIETARAGLLMSVQPLVMALISSPSGWLSDRFGSRGLATAGMLILAAGTFGLAGPGADGGELQIVFWLSVIGLGTGIFISPNSSALMGAAPRHQQGIAGSVMAQARVLGMLIGVAVATAIFHAGGGRTGSLWRAEDFAAMQMAFYAATAIAIAGALAASLRGRS
jgi:MFS family permease